MAEAYFLEPDDAKTLGDLDYMRTAKAVRRSFAKSETLGRTKEGEETRMISATETRNLLGGESEAKTSSFSAPQAPTFGSSQSTTPSPERRKTDTGMDMFRNMARNIRK